MDRRGQCVVEARLRWRGHARQGRAMGGGARHAGVVAVPEGARQRAEGLRVLRGVDEGQHEARRLREVARRALGSRAHHGEHGQQGRSLRRVVLRRPRAGEDPRAHDAGPPGSHRCTRALRVAARGMELPGPLLRADQEPAQGAACRARGQEEGDRQARSRGLHREREGHRRTRAARRRREGRGTAVRGARVVGGRERLLATRRAGAAVLVVLSLWHGREGRQARVVPSHGPLLRPHGAQQVRHLHVVVRRVAHAADRTERESQARHVPSRCGEEGALRDVLLDRQRSREARRS